MGVWQGMDAAFLADDVLCRADSLWAAAERLAETDTALLLRVRAARMSVDYACIETARNRGTAWLPDHEEFRLDVDPAFRERVSRFAATARRCGFERIREYDTTPDEYIAAIHKSVVPRILALHNSVQTKDVHTGYIRRVKTGAWRTPPPLKTLADARPVRVDGFAVPPADSTGTLAAVFEGYVDVPADGVWCFATVSDGFSALVVAGEGVVRNGGIDPVRERAGYIALRQGKHPVRAEFFTLEGGQRLEVFMEGPGVPKRRLGNE
jgi:hypothetical protein